MKKYILILLLLISFVSNGQFSSVTNVINYQNNGNDIVALYPTNNVRVPVGTAFGSINFSGYRVNSVLALLTDGSLQRLTVTWATGSYSTSAGTYSISGTITLPSGITNNNNVAATLSVQVVTLETEYSTILSQGTTNGATLPTPINQGDGNALMAVLKSNSIFSQLNLFRAWATDGNAAFANLNWVTPASFLAVATNSPTYSLNGVTGNASNMRITETWVPSTNGGSLFTQNEAGFGVYIAALGNNSTAPYATSVNNSGGTSRIGVRQPTGGAVAYHINGPTGSGANDYVGRGNYHIFRTSSSTNNLWRGGVVVANAQSNTSAALVALAPDVLARNNNGSHDLQSAATIAITWYGASLTAKTTAMNNVISQYIIDTKKYPVFGFTTLDFWGDSMTAPDDVNSWCGVFNAFLFYDRTRTNHGIAASSFGQMTQLVNQQLADAGLTSMWIDMTGYNTVHRYGAGAGSLNMCTAYMSSAFVAHAAHSYTAAASATIVSGFANTFDATVVGGRFTTGRYSNTGGAGTIRYTFTGPKKVAVQLIGNNGSVDTYGTCQIVIDGKTQETVNLNDNWTNVGSNENAFDTRRIPVAFFYNVTGTGNHTIDVVANGDGLVPVDFFAELNEPALVQPMLFGTIPYAIAVDAAQVSLGITTGAVQNAMLDVMSAKKIQQVNRIKTFGYIAAIGNVNMPYYNYLVDHNADNIHPIGDGIVAWFDMFKDLWINQIIK